LTVRLAIGVKRATDLPIHAQLALLGPKSLSDIPQNAQSVLRDSFVRRLRHKFPQELARLATFAAQEQWPATASCSALCQQVLRIPGRAKLDIGAGQAHFCQSRALRGAFVRSRVVLAARSQPLAQLEHTSAQKELQHAYRALQDSSAVLEVSQTIPLERITK